MLSAQALIINFFLFLTCFIFSFLFIKYTLKDLKFLKVSLLLYSLQYCLLLLISISSYIWEIPHMVLPSNLTYTSGFLNILPDSIGYHYGAITISSLTELPSPRVLGGHAQTIAVIYKLFGVFPMHAIVINLWFLMIISCTIYRINSTLNSSQSARWAAYYVLLSPNIFLLNSQMLKDNYNLLLTILVIYLIFQFIKGRKLFKPCSTILLGFIILFCLFLFDYRIYLCNFIFASFLLVLFTAIMKKYFTKDMLNFPYAKTVILILVIPLAGICSKILKPHQLSGYLFVKEYQHSKYIDFSEYYKFMEFFRLDMIPTVQSGYRYTAVPTPKVSPQASPPTPKVSPQASPPTPKVSQAQVTELSTFSKVIGIIKKYQKTIINFLFFMTLALLFFLWLQFLMDPRHYFEKAFICFFSTLYCCIAYFGVGMKLGAYHRINENGFITILTTINLPLAWQTITKIRFIRHD